MCVCNNPYNFKFHSIITLVLHLMVMTYVEAGLK